MDCREKARRYLELIYTSHKADDIECWNHLLDCIFDYVDIRLEKSYSAKHEPLDQHKE